MVSFIIYVFGVHRDIGDTSPRGITRFSSLFFNMAAASTSVTSPMSHPIRHTLFPAPYNGSSICSGIHQGTPASDVYPSMSTLASAASPSPASPYSRRYPGSADGSCSSPGSNCSGNRQHGDGNVRVASRAGRVVSPDHSVDSLWIGTEIPGKMSTKYVHKLILGVQWMQV